MKLRITLLSLFTFFSFYSLQAQCNGAQFEEENGYVVIEGESFPTSSSWRKESSKSGYTGSGYLIWRGTQYFGSPGNGLIQVKVQINTPGKYRFAWRNTIGIIAPSNASTEHNDSWLRFPDADEFYGEKSNGSRVYPVGRPGSPKPNGASANGWFKVYVNNLNYTWSTFTSDFDGHNIYAEFDSPGVYTIQISARSSGHIIDRLIMHRVGSTSFSSATSLSRSQTLCDGSTPPPPPPPPPGENDPPSVNITSPTNGANFAAGSNITVNLNSGDPDGNLSQHQIYVNNALVDTDGANYTPHIITNAQPGSYAIRAKVTDTNGATDEATVNITVGSGNPPPPPPPPPGGNNPPTVTINSPSNGQNFTAGSTVTVGVSSNDSDGSVVQHQVFVNGTLVDTDPASYTPYSIINIAAGSYNIRVTVTDNDGDTASAEVDITAGTGTPPPPPPGENRPPFVSITSPSNGQNFSVGSNVSINVNSSDEDGTVVQHQVFVNDVLVDTDPASYTPHIISNIAAGNYQIRVAATDNDGETSSAVINISAGSGNPPPPPPGNDINLFLIDAASDLPIGSAITNGSTLSDNSNINIQATTTLLGDQSAYFRLSGPLSRVWTENAEPYALFGDLSGDYVGENLAPGSYTLVVEIYSGSNRLGALLGSYTVNFSVASGTANNTSGKGYVYPNPIENGQFSVKIPDNIKGVVGYSLISTSGAEIKTGTVNVSKGVDRVVFDEPTMNSSNDGIYYLILQSTEQRYTIPIIKK